jgi:hypothetical protein
MPNCRYKYRVVDCDAFNGESVEMIEYMSNRGWQIKHHSEITQSPKSDGYYFVRIVFEKLFDDYLKDNMEKAADSM